MADVALNAVSFYARTSEQFIKMSARVLFSLQKSSELQKVAFKTLWNRGPPTNETSPRGWVVALLQFAEHEHMAVEACRAFCLLHLQRALNSAPSDWDTVVDMMMDWLRVACQSHSCSSIELVLRRILACASDKPDGLVDVQPDPSIHIPPFCYGFQFDWGVALPLRSHGAVRPELLLRHANIWTDVLAVAGSYKLSHLLALLKSSLQKLSDQLADSSLTLQAMLSMAPLNRWRASKLTDLLQAAAHPVGSEHLEDLFDKARSGKKQSQVKFSSRVSRCCHVAASFTFKTCKVEFMLNFENAVLHKLPRLFRGAKRQQWSVQSGCTSFSCSNQPSSLGKHAWSVSSAFP